MDMTFTTEFPWNEQEVGPVESWCQQHLRGPWRVVARYVISSGDTRIDLRVDTAEDLALVQLTWQ